jgi:hypothetical protein
MHMSVGPAKREGRSKAIFDAPLTVEAFRIGPDDGAVITLHTTGIYDDKGQYRYVLKLSRDELELLLGRGAQDGYGATPPDAHRQHIFPPPLCSGAVA